MDKHTVWIDGVSTDEIGIVLQDVPKLSAPVPRIEAVKIAGRNGDLHFWDGSYNNRTLRMLCYVYRDEFVKDAFGIIQKWAFPKNGVVQIDMDDDPTHYMVGVLENGAEVAARIDKLAPFELRFSVSPQRFLKSGQIPISFNLATSGGGATQRTFELFSPTSYDAKPILRFSVKNGKEGDGYLVSNGSQGVFLRMRNGTSTNFEIDTQNNSISSDVENDVVLDYIAEDSNVFSLFGGQNNVSLTGPDNVEKFEIVPRWWEL